MNRVFGVLLGVMLAFAVAGCGNEADKNINKNKDRPVFPPPEKPDQVDKK